jgi:prepilin-type N-terminal cleavage/methylation domain-containing protein
VSPLDRIPAANRPSRQAFSLVEVLIATMIMGVLLVAAMQTVGSSVRAETSNADRCQGLWLAQELMSEILVAKYVEPDETPTFGPEALETGGTRSAFDDVDDYHGWNASPPENQDGTEVPDRANWRRTVTVEHVDPGDLTTAVGTDQGVKRITVTVKRNDKTVAQLVGIRTDTDQHDG